MRGGIKWGWGDTICELRIGDRAHCRTGAHWDIGRLQKRMRGGCAGARGLGEAIEKRQDGVAGRHRPWGDVRRFSEARARATGRVGARAIGRVAGRQLTVAKTVERGPASFGGARRSSRGSSFVAGLVLRRGGRRSAGLVVVRRGSSLVAGAVVEWGLSFVVS